MLIYFNYNTSYCFLFIFKTVSDFKLLWQWTLPYAWDAQHSVSKPRLHPWDAQACLEWCLVSQSPSLAWLRQNGISQCETSTHIWENFQVGCILGKCHEELNLSILAPRSLVSWNLNDVGGAHLKAVGMSCKPC